MGATRKLGNGRREPDVIIEESGAGMEVDAEAIDRALELLAQMALRRSQKVLEKTEESARDAVTADSSKG